jgi:flagellar secretion chaperone FliS
VTYDLTGVYRSAQVTTSSPAAQVVLLYEGAIRFAAQSVQRLQAKDLEGAHAASLRAQAIISALRESLDMSQGEIAIQLDAIYDFMLRRLVAANVGKQPGPVLEVIGLLRDLLESWRQVAQPAPAASTLPGPKAVLGAQSLVAIPMGGLAGIRA